MEKQVSFGSFKIIGVVLLHVMEYEGDEREDAGMVYDLRMPGAREIGRLEDEMEVVATLAHVPLFEPEGKLQRRLAAKKFLPSETTMLSKVLYALRGKRGEGNYREVRILQKK